MAEPRPLELLFTPQKTSKSAAETVPQARSSSKRTPFVAPPRLPSSERKEYKDMPEEGPTKEIALPADEVVGEYTDETGRHFYYARYRKGDIHKVRHVSP